MGHEQRKVGGNWTLRLPLAALLLALSVIFVAENFVVVEVRFFIWRTDARLAWALLIAGALGFGLGLLTPRLRRYV
jgi:uncharacterized integral membrane protein